MKKTLLLLTCLFAALLACATEIDINGTFEKRGPNGFPLRWMPNGWSGYKPASTIEIVEGGGLTGHSLKMVDIRADRGSAFNSTFYPGRCGDTARLLFRARGKGKGKVQMYFQTVAGAWNFISNHEVPFLLSDSWRNFSATLPVLNGKAGETGSFDLAFELVKGAEIEISDIHLDLETGTYRGDLPFPDKWTVFGPFDEQFTLAPSDFQTIPQTVNGKTGQTFTRKAQTLDLAELLPNERQSAWLFTTIDAPYDCDYSIGAGADWWMAFYLNGQPVIDTLLNGNVESPYSIHNHKTTVRLKKGPNLFAVRFIRGKGSAVLKIGGPRELAEHTLLLKVQHLDWIEDFNGQTVSCSGNPEHITGYPAPGLLTPTGQGVFTTHDTLVIAPPSPTMTKPAEKDTFRTIGLRVQNFGEKETAADLSLVFQNGSDSFRLTLANDPASANLSCKITENGRLLAENTCSKSALPADLLFGGDGMGRYAVTLTSLSGGDNLAMAGESPFFPAHQTLQARAELHGSQASLTADNFFLALAQEKSPHSTVPFSINPMPEFDPVKAGWKKVFADEFDGSDIDWTKWQPAWMHSDGYYTVKDGILTIKADWTDDTHKKLGSSSIKTREKFGYGYYEWRGRCKRQSGWWSAFWLYGESNSNPFYDGFEIDIYEDYYLAAMEKGKPARNVLDHNLHVYTGSTLKSWNYNSPVLEDPDAYLTIGCKWTPFEISYYLNGKLIRSQASHSPYDSVTFDPFNHACGITPLQVIVSSQINRKSGGPTSLGTFPDYFYTDYVRVYAYPDDQEPQIRWTAQPAPEKTFSKIGDTLTFSVDAKPNPRTGSKIKHVYLFDSGYLLDYKSEPPYTFDVRLTKEYYDTTDYVRPGRQSAVPDFLKTMHCYAVFAQDENGQVAHTDIWTLLHIDDGTTRPSTPYLGKAASIPGLVEAVKFDEGGENAAYHDTTPENSFKGTSGFRSNEGVDVSTTSIGYIHNGEWVSYTVDIAEAGTYEATLTYGTPNTAPGSAYLLLDGFRPIGRFTVQCPADQPKVWNCDKHATTTVNLPKGRHVIRLFFIDGINAASLNFTRK